ncbi:MAG: SIMPL domain-containing protein [Candidatus Acidiferrales bacterium]
MKRIALAAAFLFVLALPSHAQTTDVKFIADTLVVQADGTYEADPDLATLTFDISSQDKDLKQAYEKATQSMRKIVALAEKSGLKKEDISTGVLTLAPSFEGDRKKKPHSYLVRGEVTLKFHDFSQIGPILDSSVEEGIIDFRSLDYSLQDEESAKEHAVSQAMSRAVSRAKAALTENCQKPGAIRYASIDVTQLSGIARIESLPLTDTFAESFWSRAKPSAPPPPPVSVPVKPGKITVTATVQCAFQIQ